MNYINSCMGMKYPSILVIYSVLWFTWTRALNAHIGLQYNGDTDLPLEPWLCATNFRDDDVGPDYNQELQISCLV